MAPQFTRSFAGLALLALMSPFTHATSKSHANSQPPIETFPPKAELTASDGLPGNALGITVGIDGDTVVLGEDCLRIGGNPDCNLQNQGVVYVYQKPPAGWANMVQIAQLTASDGFAGDEFGTGVAISDDTIVVGSNTGKVYVFVKPASGWTNMTETAQLTDGFSQGLSGIVAIYRNTVIASGPGFINGNQIPGAVFVFTKPSAGWVTTSTFDAQLSASDGGNDDDFGFSVAINSGTIVVGAPSFQNHSGPGEVYIFVKPAGGWSTTTETAILTRTNEQHNDFFGLSVSIDKNTIAVAATQATESTGQGAVDIYVKPPSGWASGTESAELIPPTSLDEFGDTVAVDGTAIVVGCSSGVASVYVRPSNGWQSTSQPQYQLAERETQGTEFGMWVASGNHTIVVGAPYQTVNGNLYQGAAFVYGPLLP